ncbi:helix-turn-helix domain-containing protein [Mesorhizobium sp. WSM3876]|uniref:helix-turn-helix domain-containing protein n=1 Tax=Mesorhizobium sp. WSM3876 TaxID=422277 RepID=UPI000BAFD19C|nr:helix-turn-helix domain-containing protein [Mesorhizobium sp. WSM3876]PBB85724.1 DNA-binding protein [Mesorhizobium sp. WSM3876]
MSTPDEDEPGSDALWGAKAIAKFLGLNVERLYSLADEPDCPIGRPSGRYFARKSELREWLRKK